ncbi:zinc finger protein ZXDC [Periophthalmus magnuspinnatus]|uniref:zinc finger protein ZXDC n=1 Tax=Periophthalmus magnuspinnatus TaxID=409849 RepID=UPI00145ACEF1|nr:zinc finger protein ZXDC [Periophthalmus magnuspinnatus]
MEIQGLSDAQNNHSQHGALCGPTLSPAPTTSTPRTRFISSKCEVDGQHQSDNNNNNNNTRPRTAACRLQAEHGSAEDCPPAQQTAPSEKHSAAYKCSNFRKHHGAQFSPQQPAQTWSYSSAGRVAEGKMALSRLEEEGGQETASGLQTHHEDSTHSALNSQPAGEHGTAVCKDLQRLYVVLTVTPHSGKTEASSSGAALEPGATGSAKGKESLSDSVRASAFLEVEDNVMFCESNEDLSVLKNNTLEMNEHSFCLPDDGFDTKRTDDQKSAEEAIFTHSCDQKLPANSCTHGAVSKVPVDDLDDGSAFVSVGSDLMETLDSPDIITDGQQSSATQLTMSSDVPGNETFSGTIMINNQNIIVTIDNGFLTFTTPPEGAVHKEEDLVSLKEQLGMKDYEDFVLLNYDGGAKTIGKINTLAASSSSEMKDSELSLVDDCSTLYTLTEADLITPSPKAAALNTENEEVHGPIKSKKEIISLFTCPEPGCAFTFVSRQKLKVHQLHHAEDPRPFQCTVEGCGWAFATSYKLKRHLQSHDKQRPFECTIEGCDRRFTTVYNLKAHIKNHKQDDAFACDICSERFRSATRLASHQRVHFEPQRPHKCDFPGCEKTFMTFSALFSHNRTHFRESGHFSCTFPGCDKTYDKACRLKIHLRSHTGERPFVCDSEGCGWSFTSMSKLLRHKRKHDDDRRFICTEEGCGKSFTRAEHLKGHSITHLGTKPFQCHAEGCNARFSARSSLYIHSKKHKQDASSLRNRCPVADCTKHFSSRSSLKSHMLKGHHISPDVLSQMEMTPALTPSSELVSPSPALVPGGGTAVDQLTNLDLSSLLSGVSTGTVPTAGIGVGIPVSGASSSGMFTMDLSMVSSSILTIDPSSVGSTLSTRTSTTLAKAVDPLLLAAGTEMGSHEALERSVEEVLPPQGTLNLDDVQSVTPEALGSLSSLSIQGAGVSADSLSVETTAPVVELLASPPKAPEGSGPGSGPLLSCVEVMETQEGEKVLTQFVFPGPGNSFSPQKDSEHTTVSPSSFLETGGSARTDYRAIQLAKKKKQRGSISVKRAKIVKAASTPLSGAGPHYSESTTSSTRAPSLRDATPQYVHIQLLQDDPASDGDLAFQLSSQPSTSHAQLTVDLPVNILQEPSGMTEEDNNSENSQFTGSTINLQDLE